MYRSIKHTHRWPLKSHLYWQFGSMRAAKIHQMTYLCVCAHSGVLIARVYTRPWVPVYTRTINTPQCTSNQTTRTQTRTAAEKRHTLSLPRCRFLVIASTLSLSGIFRDFNQQGGHVLLEIFCYFFISLLVGVLRISWISFQQG